MLHPPRGPGSHSTQVFNFRCEVTRKKTKKTQERDLERQDLEQQLQHLQDRQALLERDRQLERDQQLEREQQLE